MGGEGGMARISSIVIIVLVVGLAAGVFFRPALVLDKTTDAVASSLERRLPSAAQGGGDKVTPDCIQTADTHFTCRATYFDGSNSNETDYDLEIGRAGCWDATPLEANAGEPIDGCIWIIDY